MRTQNIFKIFDDDPVEQSMKHLKVQLFVAITQLIQNNGWTQTQAAKQLSVSCPRINNLLKGHLEKFSIGALIQMMINMGHELNVDFDTADAQQPLTIQLKICGVIGPHQLG